MGISREEAATLAELEVASSIKVTSARWRNPMLKNESAVEVEAPKYMAVKDGEDQVMVPFGVSEALYQVLEEQRTNLDFVDPATPSKSRYTMARESGCYAAVAKGAKDH